jgi:hypothetical protein
MSQAQLAKDVGTAVFKTGELSESNAKFMLKNATTFTAESMKSLTPTEKAQAVVGMQHLASEVKNGLMGDFKTLPENFQKTVLQAEQTMGKLQTQLMSDQKNHDPLAKAHLDLKQDGSHAANNESAAQANKAPEQQAGGRSLER